MSENTADAAPATGYGGLQGAHMLPATDGGGVVYPLGFFGPSYYLPEWEFIHFNNEAWSLELRMAQASWRHWFRRGFSTFDRVFVLCIVMVGLYAFMISGLPYLQRVSSWAAIGGLGAFYYRVAWIHFIHPRKFRAVFPTAERLRFSIHWWSHVLAALMVVDWRTYFILLWQVAINTGLGYIVYAAWRGDIVHLLIAAAIVPALLALILQPAIMGLCFLVLRLHLGRPPTGSDLPPVDPPVRAA